MGNDSYSLAKSFGYMTQDEVRMLKHAIRMIASETPVLVNIGAGAGTSALAMREEKPSAMIFSVDVSKGGPLGGFEGETNAFRNAGLAAPAQILGESHEVAKEWDKKIDLIFIDDGHLEPEIRGDIEGWLPHVKTDGFLVFHDYGSPRWPDVMRVVNELMAGCRLIGLVDTMAVFAVVP